jgi:hypothetical protein
MVEPICSDVAAEEPWYNVWLELLVFTNITKDVASLKLVAVSAVVGHAV